MASAMSLAPARAGNPDPRLAHTRPGNAKCLHRRNVNGTQPVATLPQHVADDGIGAGHQHTLTRSHRRMHFAFAAAPRHGFERRHGVAVAPQRLAHRDLAQFWQDGGRIGPGVGGQLGVHRPAVDQGQRRRWTPVCDDNVLRQRAAQCSSGLHFARRYRPHAFDDPPHDFFERHQPRYALAMLKGGNHVGYVAGAGGRGQEGAADMLDARVWIDESRVANTGRLRPSTETRSATTGSSSTKSMRAYSFAIVCVSRSLRDRGHSLPERVGSMEGLGRIERTDGDVISVEISERKLRSSSVGIHVWLFFQPADKRARPWQSYVKVVDPEEQEEAVTRLGVVRTCQRGMLVGTPRVETEQDRSIRVDDLPEVLVGRSRLRQVK